MYSFAFTLADELDEILEHTSTLFDSKSTEFDGKRIHLEEDASVVYRAERKELILHSQLEVYTQELDQLIRKEVLEKEGWF